MGKVYRQELDKMKAKLNERRGAWSQLNTEIANLNARTLKHRTELQHSQEMQVLLQRTSDAARQYGKGRLEEIVTSALQFVFGPDVSFEIELYETAGRPQAEFYLVTEVNGEHIKTRPMESNGGGVVDIIALALRIAVLQIHNKPGIMGPIILDEPGKHVSEEYAEKMATFLKEMSAYFDRQIIMVTHQPYLAQVADNNQEIQLINGKSQVMP
ncbi:chromosome segregation protein [compost metagenome]